VKRQSDYELQLQQSLSTQHDDLQSGYLGIIQQQVESLMRVTMKSAENSKGHSSEGTIPFFMCCC
jgi:hypothetical protein